MILTPRFVHLTASLESLNGILQDGLLIRQRRRNVWKWFSKDPIYRKREPQQFGMTSLHQYRIRPSSAAVRHFGPFGVELKSEWVKTAGFREVSYVEDQGQKYEILRSKYQDALIDLESRLASEDPTDQFPLMSFTNVNCAGWIGAEKWVNFLLLFETMEPYKHRKQREWRFSRPIPYYGDHSVDELVDDLRRKDNWTQHIHLLKFGVADVSSIFLPRKHIADFRLTAPTQYRAQRIKYLPDGSARIDGLSKR